jgi:hypothetical protein
MFLILGAAICAGLSLINVANTVSIAKEAIDCNATNYSNTRTVSYGFNNNNNMIPVSTYPINSRRNMVNHVAPRPVYQYVPQSVVHPVQQYATQPVVQPAPQPQPVQQYVPQPQPVQTQNIPYSRRNISWNPDFGNTSMNRLDMPNYSQPYPVNVNYGILPQQSTPTYSYNMVDANGCTDPTSRRFCSTMNMPIQQYQQQQVQCVDWRNTMNAHNNFRQDNQQPRQSKPYQPIFNYDVINKYGFGENLFQEDKNSVVPMFYDDQWNPLYGPPNQ